jgi:hypothetical protein
MYSNRYSSQILVQLDFSGQILEKSLNTKLYENPSRRNRVVPSGRTDVTKLIAAFNNVTNALIKFKCSRDVQSMVYQVFTEASKGCSPFAFRAQCLRISQFFLGCTTTKKIVKRCFETSVISRWYDVASLEKWIFRNIAVKTNFAGPLLSGRRCKSSVSLTKDNKRSGRRPGQ